MQLPSEQLSLGLSTTTVSVAPVANAFAFNLYESAGDPGVKFGIELIGAGVLDDDPDWPCEEVWKPEPRGIGIPMNDSGGDWESCFARMKTLVEKLLAETARLPKV